MYSFSEAIRELNPKFDNISNTELARFRVRAESRINIRLGSKYFLPIQKASNELGTITLDNASTTVTGVDTTFTQLQLHDYISVNGIVVRVDSITSDTIFIASHVPERSVSGGNWFIVPTELATATEYMTASLVAKERFSSQAFNQETIKYSDDYKSIADEDIKILLESNYYNSLLKPAIKANGLGRMPYWSRQKATTRTDIDGNILNEVYTTLENNY